MALLSANLCHLRFNRSVGIVSPNLCERMNVGSHFKMRPMLPVRSSVASLETCSFKVAAIVVSSEARS